MADFAAYVGAPYMFRIQNAQGQPVYRTDIHSRWQIGRGSMDPAAGGWDGDPAHAGRQGQLQRGDRPGRGPGGVRADQLAAGDDRRRRLLAGPSSRPGCRCRPASRTWSSTSCTSARWASGDRTTGTLADAMRLLDYLVDLGVNAVELLPLAEFSGNLGWGYGNTHHFAIESSAGGRDKYKHFVRACHQRGIAVHPRRRLQPLRRRRRPGRVAVRLDPARAEHLLLVRGQQQRLPLPRRRLPQQRVLRVRAPLLGGAGPPAVHQQRRRADRGVPRRRAAGRPHPGHPPRQRGQR